MYVIGHIKNAAQPTFGIFTGEQMSVSVNKSSNHLLAALPENEWLRWESQLELVDLKLGQVLYESGGKMEYVYFPINAIVSLLFVLENGLI